MELKDLIKFRRKQLRLPQKQLGDLIGVSSPTIARYESGEITNMGRDKIYLLAKALEVPATQLMGWDESKAQKSATDDDAFKGLKDSIDALVMMENVTSLSDLDQMTMIRLMEIARSAIGRYIEDSASAPKTK